MKPFLAVFCSLVFLTSCATTDNVSDEPVAPAGPINAVCPIMGGDVDPEATTVMYDGHAIGFCCNGCDSKWDAWSDEQKAEFVEQSLQNQ